MSEDRCDVFDAHVRAGPDFVCEDRGWHFRFVNANETPTQLDRANTDDVSMVLWCWAPTDNASKDVRRANGTRSLGEGDELVLTHASGTMQLNVTIQWRDFRNFRRNKPTHDFATGLLGVVTTKTTHTRDGMPPLADEDKWMGLLDGVVRHFQSHRQEDNIH
jgi:hypothetical protein